MIQLKTNFYEKKSQIIYERTWEEMKNENLDEKKKNEK